METFKLIEQQLQDFVKYVLPFYKMVGLLFKHYLRMNWLLYRVIFITNTYFIVFFIIVEVSNANDGCSLKKFLFCDQQVSIMSIIMHGRGPNPSEYAL